MCSQPPVELVKFCYEAFHYMLVWRSYYAVWAPAHVRRLLDSCHTSNMFHFLETLPPPPPLLALSPSSFSTPLCGKHIFCYRINLMIISIHEVSHCKQYCTIRAFRYSIVGSDQLFWGRGGLLVCTSRGALEPAAVAGDCNSADGKFMLSIRTL